MEKRLIDSVIAQLDLDDGELESTMSDIRNHGADGGFSGFIYYNETCNFARENMESIYSHAKNQAADLGIDPLEMIAGFNCLRGEFPSFEIASVIHDDIDDATRNDGADTAILNALAWYALEEAARHWEHYEVAG
tara:strand:- start:2028 stop:2432 length:405 start_codon:yes stop_codon:yes gene_type:complete